MPKILGIDKFIDSALIINGSILPEDLAASTNNILPPLGTIMSYSGNADAGNWLVCNGRPISRVTYAALYALVGNRFGSGDGSTTFLLPDFQGRFLRGATNSNPSGRDPDAASRSAMATGGSTGDNVGSVQTDAMQRITGNPGIVSGFSGYLVGSFTSTGAVRAGATFVGMTGGGGAMGQAWSFDSAFSPGAKTSTESRPANAYVNFIIRVI